MFASGEVDLVRGAVQPSKRDPVSGFVPFAHMSVAAVGLSKRMSELLPFDARLNGKFSVNVRPRLRQRLQRLRAQRDAAFQKMYFDRLISVSPAWPHATLKRAR